MSSFWHLCSLCQPQKTRMPVPATQPRLIHKNVLLHTSYQDFEFHSWPITFLLTSILHTPVCLVHLLLTVELEKLKQAFDSVQSISRIIGLMASGDRKAIF